jgi:outer membrane protein OmpA-like peptidoglycan-associated protein
MRRRWSGIALGTVLATVPAAPLAAQRAGAFEFGAFGRYTWFQKAAVNLDDTFGGSALLGVFFHPVVALEVGAAYTPAKTIAPADLSVKHVPMFGRLVLNVPAHERFTILLGAGYQRTNYVVAGPDPSADNGVMGLLGFRAFLSGGLAIRGHGLVDFVPSPRNPGPAAGADPTYLHYGAELGLSYLFGKAPRDRDRDGVPDNRDACLETPAGVQVESNGCPVDADRDGVPDYQDRCASTPAGASVDTNGCPADSDGDAVFDGLDQCPRTPAGANVDARGCPTDADGDNVFDGLDQCPNTPAGAPVDARGCPLDGDGDGVIDLTDRCPNTPAGARVDTNGCPMDADGDRVFDGLDRCPNTAAGQQVDANGCPILFEADKPTLVLQGVTFATGSAQLTGDSRTVLDIVAESLRGNPDVRVEVGGHTDNTGSSVVNTRLSQARAEAVRDYLLSRGVATDRMTARGYGPENPVADNRTAAGRQRNRRVELRKIN